MAKRKCWDKEKREENKKKNPNIEMKSISVTFKQPIEEDVQEDELNEHPIFYNNEELNEVLFYVEKLLLNGFSKRHLTSHVQKNFSQHNFTNETIDKLISLTRSKMVNDFFLDKRYLIIEHIRKLDTLYFKALQDGDDRMAFLCLQERGKVLNLQLTTDENANIESYLENKIKTFQVANEKFDDISIKDIE